MLLGILFAVDPAVCAKTEEELQAMLNAFSPSFQRIRPSNGNLKSVVILQRPISELNNPVPVFNLKNNSSIISEISC